MNKRSLSTLIVLNVVLLVALLLVALSPRPAEAQLRGRSEYAMISGRVTGLQSKDMIYVVDLNSGWLAALVYESANDRLIPIARYNLSADLAGRTRGR